MRMYILVLRSSETLRYIILLWLIRIVSFQEYLLCEIIDL